MEANMWKTLGTLGFIGLLATLLPDGLRVSSQQGTDILLTNNCANCHSKISAPLSLSNKYFEWHVSLHRDNNIGCETCHGGDPTTKDKDKAHQQVRPASDQQSKVHPASLPDTCSACHSAVVKSFIGSTHYQKLKGSGLGPSCTTCHAHMASAVAKAPAEAAARCASCHNTVNGPLPARPEIPEKATEMMEALGRANTMVVWADRLLEVGQQKQMSLTQETEQLKSARAALSEAQVAWHALSFAVVRKKADEAFELGTKVKDQLMKKLYPQPGQ
jgi:cytochrome c1